MEITIGKILALVVALGYTIAIVVAAGGVSPPILGLIIMLTVPLGLIWFPEEIGGITGYVGRGGSIDVETPPVMVSAAGWLLLVGLPLAILLLGR